MSRYIDIIPGETPLAKELRQVAEILEARGMSAEMINMTLAARAGLPVAPVDPKSPVFVWEKEEAPAPAPEPPAPTKEELLLTEIRDLLKEQKK